MQVNGPIEWEVWRGKHMVWKGGMGSTGLLCQHEDQVPGLLRCLRCQSWQCKLWVYEVQQHHWSTGGRPRLHLPQVLRQGWPHPGGRPVTQVNVDGTKLDVEATFSTRMTCCVRMGALTVQLMPDAAWPMESKVLPILSTRQLSAKVYLSQQGVHSLLPFG